MTEAFVGGTAWAKPAAAIFKVLGVGGGPAGARNGELLGVPTPAFTVMTSNAMPLYLRPETLGSTLQGKLLFEVPAGDVVVRKQLLEGSPQREEGCRGCWPHLRDNVSYCSFRNPRQNPSVHGGDAILAIETGSGRRKVGPKELLEIQKAAKADIVAAPGEEVTLDVAGHRRLHRAVSRAGDWIKEICEAKSEDKDGGSWHVLAAIQGGSDLKLRQKACATSLEHPISGVWVGGLGYDESLHRRGEVLRAVTGALPAALPRFLPLCAGNPVEVLQAVLLGVDVLEVPYPTTKASEGIALIFDTAMPGDGPSDAVADEILLQLVPEAPGEETAAAPGEGGSARVAVAAAPPPPLGRALPQAVRELKLRGVELREDFSPICEGTPVPQYSRAYLCHLFEVRELLGMMLLSRHNLHWYKVFLEQIRKHIQQGTIRRYAAWFLETQTCEPLPADPVVGPAKKRRRHA